MISIKDFSIAYNSLSNAKGYVFTIVLTMGLTLGALVAMFNLNYQLLAKPLPYPDQDRLVMLKGDLIRDGKIEFADMYAYPAAIEIYKDDNGYFEQKALVNFNVDIVRSLPEAPQVNITYSTPEYLQMLKQPMSLGRNFNLDEGLDSNAPVAIISYLTWEQLFNQDPNILNKTIRFGEIDFKIVGVTAPDFIEPQLMRIDRLTQVWLPWDYNLELSGVRKAWGMLIQNLYLVGKLNSINQLQKVEHDYTTRLDTRYQEEVSTFFWAKGNSIKFHLTTYRNVILGNSKNRVLLLFAGALALLFIAAANITNLILARAANQQRNMAIRASLGAQRFHLFNAVLAEVLLLMLAAMVLALLIAFGGIELLKQVAHNLLPRLAELYLSWQSLGFAVASALLLAFLFALLVGHQINYRALNTMLQSSGKGVGIQISAKIRYLLILVQVALTGILLTVSLQILQESWRHIIQPLGFATKDVYQVPLNIGSQLSQPPEERKQNLIAMRHDLMAHPKVDSASLGMYAPINSANFQWHSYLSVDQDFKEQRQTICSTVDEHYLQTLGPQLVAGRHFNSEEFLTDANVIIINETLAHRLQADGKVLNQSFFWMHSYKGKVPYEVIGIIRDLSLPGKDEEPRMFVPQASVMFPQWLIKLKSEQQLTSMEINELMAKVNGQYKVAELLPMVKAHQLLVAQDVLWAGISAALAFIALCLAAIGVYGVLSYSVHLRRFELGIRMAIGARPITIFIQILRDNLAPVILGLVVMQIVLALLWVWVQQSAYMIQPNILSYLIPIFLILMLTAAASLLAVWRIIRKPASYALMGA